MAVTSLTEQEASFSFNNVRYLGHCYGLQIESFLAVDISPQNSIMLGGGFKSERLRVNLRLVINRLKLLEKKKSKFGCLQVVHFKSFGCSKFSWFDGIELAWSELAELAQKARKEIADYLSAGKDERARIRVEHIIREDYLVEAMEILELYCDLLITRFGLIQSMKWVTFYYYYLFLFFHPCS